MIRPLPSSPTLLRDSALQAAKLRQANTTNQTVAAAQSAQAGDVKSAKRNISSSKSLEEILFQIVKLWPKVSDEALTQVREQLLQQRLGQPRQTQQPILSSEPLPGGWLIQKLSIPKLEEIKEKPQCVQPTTTRVKRSLQLEESKSEVPKVFEQDMSSPECKASEHVDTSWALRESIFAQRVSYDRITQEVTKLLGTVQKAYEEEIASIANDLVLDRSLVEQNLVETLNNSSGITLHLKVKDIDGVRNTYIEKHHANSPAANTLAEYFAKTATSLSNYMTHEIKDVHGEDKIDILEMNLRLTYPHLKEMKSIHQIYVRAFDIRSINNPDSYANPLSQAGKQAIKLFFRNLSEELAYMKGDVQQSPTFKEAIQRVVAYYRHNAIISEENTALKELLLVYYQAMAENLKTQQHLLLNTLPTQGEFLAKTLCQQLGVDKKYWPVLRQQKFYMQFSKDRYTNQARFGDSYRQGFRKLSYKFFPKTTDSMTLLDMLYDESFRNKVAGEVSNASKLSQALAQSLKIPNADKQGIADKIKSTLFEQDHLLVYNIGPSNSGLSDNLREPKKSYKNFLDTHIRQRIEDYKVLETERVILTSSNAVERLRNNDPATPLDSLLTAQEKQTIQTRSHHFKTALNDITNGDDYRALSTNTQHVLDVARQVVGYIPFIGPELSLLLDVIVGDDDDAAFDAFLCLTMLIPNTGELSALKKLVNIGTNTYMASQAVRAALQARDCDDLALVLLNIEPITQELYHSGVSIARWRALEILPHQNIKAEQETLENADFNQILPSESESVLPLYAVPSSLISGLSIDEDDGTYHAHNKQYIKGEDAYVYEVKLAPQQPNQRQVVNPATGNPLYLVGKNATGTWNKLGLDGGGGFQSTHRLSVSIPDKVEVINGQLYINGKKANTKKLKFIDLQRSKLERVNLNKAKIKDANLDRVNLRCAGLLWASLEHVDLYWADLSYADLRWANLSYVDLQDATLIGASLQGADLTCTYLERADLTGVNLLGALLSMVRLSRANLKRVILIEADLIDVDMSYADMRDADMSGANLKKVNFKGAKLSGAKLTEAKLLRCNLLGANFTGVDLTNAIIRLQNHNFLDNPDEIDLQLNHLNNRRSLLTVINTIDNQYIDLKINVLHQIIDQLEGVDVSTPTFPRQALIDAIASNVAYLADNRIRHFITPLINHEINAANSAPTLFNTRDNVSASILRFIRAQCTVADESLRQTNQQRYMIDNNGAFMQLIARFAYSENVSVQNIARNLYDQYLTLPAVEKIAKNSDFGDMSGNGTPLWNAQDAFNLIFVKDDHALMMSHKMLEKIFKNDVDAWNQCFYYADGENQRQDQVGQRRLFTKIFPAFANNYRFTENNKAFQKLLSILKLGDYHTRFTEALAKNSFDQNEKLIKAMHQEKLAAIFNRVIENQAEDAKKTELREAHFADLLGAFHLEGKTPQVQAQTLFALATVFSKYSSSSVFGTEFDSPQALRNYAYALLAKAHALDKTVFVEDGTVFENGRTIFAPGSFKDLEARLLGLDDAFTCTAVVSEIMATHAKDHFIYIYNSIVPPAWA